MLVVSVTAKLLNNKHCSSTDVMLVNRLPKVVETKAVLLHDCRRPCPGEVWVDFESLVRICFETGFPFLPSEFSGEGGDRQS